MPKERIGAVELFYEIDGDGKDVIAFVNGVGMTVASWAPQSDFFKSQYKCLFHDTRGQLMSGNPPGEFSMEMHANDLKNLLDHLDIEKVHLIGTSYGAEIAMIFAYTYPERTKSLTAITGVSELNEVMRLATRSWAHAAQQHDAVGFYLNLSSWAYSPGFLKNNRSMIEQKSSLISQLPTDFFDGFVKLIGAFLELDITANLHKITCPTHIISAEMDIIKPPRFSELIHRKIKGSTYTMIPGAGHAVVIEKPEELNSLMDEFIQSVG